MVATLAHFAIDPSSSTPLVGASGAISGVLGAYLVLYTITVIELRAAILLGLWFVWQLFQGLISLGLSSQVNVAFFAHIGGFVAGSLILVAIKLVAHEPLKPVNPRRSYLDWWGWIRLTRPRWQPDSPGLSSPEYRLNPAP